MTMTCRQPNFSKKLKPFVDPETWKDLQDPVKEALRGPYGLCKGDGLKTRCLAIVGLLHLVGDGTTTSMPLLLVCHYY
jgi:hypothetical protein